MSVAFTMANGNGTSISRTKLLRVLAAWRKAKKQQNGQLKNLSTNGSKVQIRTFRTMKFATDRPYTDPEAAARLLLDIVRGSVVESDMPYAYTGATNSMLPALAVASPSTVSESRMPLSRNG